MRLIDADALMPNAEYKGKNDLVSARDIANAPTIDAVPVRHGEWTDDVEERCSVCGAEVTLFYNGCDGIVWAKYPLPNYCPNCGARMNGKEQS